MDGRGSVPMSSHISIEEFLEQRGTDHPAPRGEGEQELITVASCLEKTLMPANGLGGTRFIRSGAAEDRMLC